MKSKKFIFAIIITALFVVTVLVQQAIAYYEGDKSFVFGQQLGYTQTERMPLNGFLLSIQKIERQIYAAPALKECDAEEAQESRLRSSVTNIFCKGDNRYKQYQAAKKEGMEHYEIKLSIVNDRNTVTTLPRYRFSSDNDAITIFDEEVEKGSIVPGASKAASLQIRAPENIKKMRLLIRNKDTTKYFEISL